MCEPETVLVATLWVVMTWFMDVVQVAPLAVITAPEKRCGKTQLLNLLGKISHRPLLSSNISPAVLYRSIEKWQPTLLIDEADTFIKDNENLRGLLNAGHSRDLAFTLRCVGDDHEPKKFNLWGAKALSGIGKLADTIMDRAIILELRRKLPGEKILKLRYAPDGLFETIQKKLARFSDDYREIIKNARPDIPDVLNDRAQDNWEPLLAIADTAGSKYGCLAREAAITLSGNNDDDQSQSVQLLSDIYEIFEANEIDKISSDELIRVLCQDKEKPWATYNSRSEDSRISPRQLGRLLSDFNIKSGNLRGCVNLKTGVRNNTDVKKGYCRSQFEDAFQRYLPSSMLAEISATSATTS